MSLIHDALKSMDAPQGPKSAAMRPPTAAARTRPAWLDAFLTFAVVLGLGALGWYLWQNQRHSRADLTQTVTAPVPAPAPAADGGVAPQAVAASVEPVTAAQTDAIAAAPAEQIAKAEPAQTSAAIVDQGPAPQSSVSSSAVSHMPMAEQSNPKSASPAHRQAPTVSPRSTAARQQARVGTPVAPAASAPVVDDTPVELRFARFVAAMKDARTADAERELAGLKERLPAGSLGLLRAQAWFDLRAGREAAAAQGYRAILERLPGDEEAAVNLASIQLRQHQTEEARATLDAAARLQPDSAALRAALAQFTPAARQ